MKQQTEYKLLTQYEFWRTLNLVSPMEVKIMAKNVYLHFGEDLDDEFFEDAMNKMFVNKAISNFFNQNKN